MTVFREKQMALISRIRTVLYIIILYIYFSLVKKQNNSCLINYLMCGVKRQSRQRILIFNFFPYFQSFIAYFKENLYVMADFLYHTKFL